MSLFDSIKRYVIGAALIGLTGAGISSAANPKLSPELEGIDAQKAADVIIQYKQTPTLAHHAKVMLRGGVVRRTLAGTSHRLAEDASSQANHSGGWLHFAKTEK